MKIISQVAVSRETRLRAPSFLIIVLEKEGAARIGVPAFDSANTCEGYMAVTLWSSVVNARYVIFLLFLLVCTLICSKRIYIYFFPRCSFGSHRAPGPSRPAQGGCFSKVSAGVRSLHSCCRSRCNRPVVLFTRRGCCCCCCCHSESREEGGGVVA